MLKAYRYFICPTAEQQELLQHQFDGVRSVYNRSLALKQYLYKRWKINLPLKRLKARLVNLRKRHEWLKAVDSQALQQSVINLDLAYRNFFTKVAKFPKFKSKRDKQSYQYPQRVKVNAQNQTCYLPKVGWVKVVLHRDLPQNGIVKTVTVTKTKTGKHFVSLLIDDGLQVHKHQFIEEDKVLGIDTGLIDLVYCSNGAHVSNPYCKSNLTKEQKSLKLKQDRIIKLQKELSRKPNKSSKRRAKVKQKLSFAHEKLTNTRNDYLHKLSLTLVGENQAIGMESLSIKNMQKNHKLAKTFANSAINKLSNFIKYKLEAKGGYFIKVDRFYPSSKLCSSCGYKKSDLSLKERQFYCDSCQLLINRDYNAALNIRKETIKELLGQGHCLIRRGEIVRPLMEANSSEASNRSLRI